MATADAPRILHLWLVGLLYACLSQLAPAFQNCHCTSGCDGNFQCASGCVTGWSGPTCQIRNIALYKSTQQSSTFNDCKVAGTDAMRDVCGNKTSSLAVDGVVSSSYWSGTCTHTVPYRTPAWWTVDLGETHLITNLRIFFSHPERMRGFVVAIDHKQICYQQTLSDLPSSPVNISCATPTRGQHVTVQLPTLANSRYILSLCEVEIYECADGSFGSDCSSSCNCRNTSEACDKTTGRCESGCTDGYTGTGCLEACTEGRYGANCQSPCGHCQGTDVCDKVTGKCPGGCQPGWWPDLCSQVCSDGRYGHHCQLECGQCKGNLPCNKINGTCDQGCRQAFKKPFCKECIDGMYGADCMSRCGQCKDALTCDKSSGECPGGCQGNLMKPLCQGCTECSATSRCLNQVVPVAATLGTLLVLALIALLTSIIYNRRLKIQLDVSLKRPEDNYIPLDERTKEPVVENTYEDIDSATPYIAALEVPQGRAETK